MIEALGKKKREAAFLLFAMLAAGVLAVEIQFIVLRPRPYGELIHFGISFPSFPSGHAAIAFAGATFLALLAPRLALPCFSLASLIAASRVVLCVHHPSDVVLGAILGSATAAVAYGAFYSDRSKGRPRWAWWLWPQLAVVLFAACGAYLGLTKFEFLQLPYADKTLHFVLFGLLAFFLLAWFHESDPRKVTGALALIAIADEASQALSPARTFDLGDLAFTLLGIGAAFWLLLKVRRLSTVPRAWSTSPSSESVLPQAASRR